MFPASLNTKKDLLTAVDGDKSQILVLDMIHIRHIDFTGCQGMSDLALDLRVRGVRLYMANVCSQVYLVRSVEGGGVRGKQGKEKKKKKVVEFLTSFLLVGVGPKPLLDRV